ncbi:MAG: helix-turn-helix transcriptional regulator [Longicatena sp.]
MSIGDKIKYLRKIRNMTQKELGVAVGFDKKNADIRIAQYEAGTRTPKPELIAKFSKALNAHVLSLMNERTQDPVMNMVFDLIDMEERAKVTLHPIEDNNSKYAISIDSQFFNNFLEELVSIRKELTDGTISYEEFIDWKVNWPLSSGTSPKYKWRHKK